LVQTTVIGDTNINVYKEPATVAFAEVAPKPVTPDTQFMYYYYESDVEDDDEVSAVTAALVEAISAAGFNGGLASDEVLRSVNKVNVPAPAVGNATANATTVAEIPLPLGVTVVARRRSDTSDTSSDAGWLSTVTPGAVAGVYTRDGRRTSRIISALIAAAVEDIKAQEAAAAVPVISEGLNTVVKAAAGMESASEDDEGKLGTSLCLHILVRACFCV
jgi:hypothetical protein